MTQLRLSLVILALSLLQSACGQSSTGRNSRDGSPDLEGDIRVGTQCPFGTISQSMPGGFVLRDCRMGLGSVRLPEEAPEILLSGDCAEKTLAVRASDGSVDSLWQVYPDGTFSLLIGGFSTGLSGDSGGSGQCLASMTMEIDGRMDCASRDIFTIRVDNMKLWLATPDENRLGIQQLPACRLPPSCRMESSLELRQCG